VAAIVSFASGKGGVGKSTTVSNLGLLLARGGSSVVLVDLDVGGADLHVMFGELSPKLTLSDFLARRVDSLEAVAQPVEWCAGLRLIAGTGDTLRNTNPASQTKRRLERHVRNLNADVILLDIGAGTNYHALDFFLWGDLQVVISTPDPTAVLDMYKFVKLAATRRVLAELGSREESSEALLGEDFRSLEQLFAAAGSAGPEVEQRARAALAGFHPALLLNNAGGERGGVARISAVIRRFLGSDTFVLGQIPADPAVTSSVRRFLPVTEADPNSPASRALKQVEIALRARLGLPAANSVKVRL
jgi:flagellar biosynthesis protein FlhG